MDYNIDILVAGCDTSCLHCYVNGGPGPQMRLEAFYLCLERLRLAFERFGRALTFTLDNELYGHAHALELLRYVADTCGDSYYHHGSTTGIALLERQDAPALLRLLREKSWTETSFAIHGGRENHDRIVARRGALETLERAAALCRSEGMTIWISLMASKCLLADRAEVAALLNRLPHDGLLPVIPDYYPTPRLRRYQSIRCEREQIGEFFDFATELGATREQLEYCDGWTCESRVFDAAREGRLALDPEARQTAFFHIDSRLDFYRGNTGSPLEYCGNIARLSGEAICGIIAATPDNYYETSDIHYADLRERLGDMVRSGTDLVYPSEISCAIAMLDNAERRQT